MNKENKKGNKTPNDANHWQRNKNRTFYASLLLGIGNGAKMVIPLSLN